MRLFFSLKAEVPVFCVLRFVVQLSHRKVVLFVPKIIPIRDMKDTSRISQMCQESDEPIFVTKNGYGNMVIMSMKTYEQSLANVGIYALLSQSLDDEKYGRIEKAREALAQIRQEYGI